MPDSFTLLDVPSETVRANNEEEREFVNVIIWTLEHEVISVEKIKRKFSMGNRANGIIDKLCGAGLVSEKFSNQPRTVLPQAAEDIPDAIMGFLTRYGITVEDVATAINKRNPSAGRGEEDSHDC